MNIVIKRPVLVQDNRESYNTPKPAVPTNILYFASIVGMPITKPYWIELSNGKGEWQHRFITATTEQHLRTLIIDHLTSRGIYSKFLIDAIIIKSTNTALRSKITTNAISIGTGIGAGA